MENLLGTITGQKWEATWKGYEVSGDMEVFKGEVYLEFVIPNDIYTTRINVKTGTPADVIENGFTNFRLLEPESKEEEIPEGCGPATGIFSDEQIELRRAERLKPIRREIAAQFACAIIKNSHDKNYERNTVNDGWWGTHVLDEAIQLTDELLKKLGD